MPMWHYMNLQDANSPIMEEMMFFHDHSLMILTMVMTTVMIMVINLFITKFTNRMLLEDQKMELIWTIMPTIILLFLAFPSLQILYLMDEMKSPTMTIKAIGNQWYWTYEYSDFMNIEFDSYMKTSMNLSSEEFRLLETDNQIVMPINTNIRIMVTATDVLHSWTMPSLGIKVDATPGRLNQTNTSIYRPEIMFGQCSEICGINHSFMPIMLESINMEYFIKWLKNF
uniref:Cytochrome c oxidase subunit 2 n=1 Tax=Kokeshia sp. NKU02 TaxID=1124182 RepID=A0A0X7Y9V8_9HEMI|nr:cytochrome c oxidase subunit II [Kokeshia sp. NKU02]